MQPFLVCVPRGHGSHDTILFDIKSYPKVLFNALFVLWQLLTQESPELLNDRQQLLVGFRPALAEPIRSILLSCFRLSISIQTRCFL